MLQKYGLPDIGYPVPREAVEEILPVGQNIDFEHMLYWLQEFCSQSPDKWPEMEPAMRRLAELIAPADNSELISIEGDDWFLHAGTVDLGSKIVTIHRRDDLIAAMRPHHDGTLILSVYHPLDAQSVMRILQLSQKPHPEYGVRMRENNWEYALDASAQGVSALYTADRGGGYLSYWESGVGIQHDGTPTGFYSQRELCPMPAPQVAVQLGVYYQLYPDESSL
jgi:hypothetical protein